MTDTIVLDGVGDDISNEAMDRHWHVHSVVVRPDYDDVMDEPIGLYHVVLDQQGSGKCTVVMYEGYYDDCVAYAQKLRDLMLGKL